MSQLVAFELGEGGSILVEVEEAGRGPVTRGRTADAITKAGESLETTLGRIGPAIRGIVAELREATEWPDEVQVEFAVKLSTDANAIIARYGGEANFRIALKWSRQEG